MITDIPLNLKAEIQNVFDRRVRIAPKEVRQRFSKSSKIEVAIWLDDLALYVLAGSYKDINEALQRKRKLGSPFPNLIGTHGSMIKIGGYGSFLHHLTLQFDAGVALKLEEGTDVVLSNLTIDCKQFSYGNKSSRYTISWLFVMSRFPEVRLALNASEALENSLIHYMSTSLSGDGSDVAV